MVKTSKNISKVLASLNKWNLIAAGLHFVQGVAVLALSGSVTFPVTTSYLTLDPLASTANQPVLAGASRHLFDINLAYFVAAFFFMSAIAHLVIATVYRKNYEADLKKGINKVRWIEYSFSASTMIVAIAVIAGINDISTLLLMFGLIAIMNLLGLVMEVHNQGAKKINWLSYIVGCIAGILPWIVYVIYVAGSGVYGGAQPPTFVYWILGSIFVLFNCFAINMYLQYKKIGKWADYMYGERVYIILSLVAKSLLAWQVFFGSLRP
jgi:hypothetical protein